MILIILAAFIILPFVLVSLGMSALAAVISWLFLIIVAIAANLWYYAFTETGREKMAERTREAARARRSRNKCVILEDDQTDDSVNGYVSEDDTSSVEFYDDWDDDGDYSGWDGDYGSDCGDGHSSGYGADCGDGNGMC